ncbi:MAG: carboxyl-terminal protease [Acidobacteria bacterium]|nr:carboxyl-terminal protease [Acidobacteriota bacterium]
MSRKLQFIITVFSLCLVGMLLLGAVNKSTSSPEETYRHIGVFTEVLSKIKSEYVEEPDMKNVTLGALNGLLESLDPYASYLSADQFKQWQKTKAEAKGWTGLVLAKRFGYVAVVDSVPGSPADKAGLSTGDMIETIQNVNTRDMPLAYAEMMLLGDPGTNVELGVLRFRNPEPSKIAIVRGPIQWPAVASKMLPDSVGLVQVSTLEAHRLADVTTAVQNLEKQGAKKLILDLRNCSTGVPEDGVALANLFVSQGRLAFSVGQKVAAQYYEAAAAKAITKLPLTVTTNRGTAGAAEIAASALYDSQRAEIVGERTYGDAAIRKAVVMDDGTAVILSIAKFHSANGKALQDTGVMPSVPVADLEPAELNDEEGAATPKKEEKPKSNEDLILKKAVEISLKGLSPAEAQAAQALREAARKAASEHGQDPTLGPLNIPKP